MNKFIFPKRKTLNQKQKNCLERILKLLKINKSGKEFGSNCIGSSLYVVGAIDNYSYFSGEEAFCYLKKMDKDPNPIVFGDLVAFMTTERNHVFHMGVVVETKFQENPIIFNAGLYQKPKICYLDTINNDQTIKEFYYRFNIFD